ncbi:DcaP family trimeric outer membrane transporter [Halomonas sp. HK25]|uniref:DcaP family trimeric outer membrane transporter n=1 Tax=Halomonas sp. HK25 TaxID=3394321 RepID=UPI0039FD4057
MMQTMTCKRFVTGSLTLLTFAVATAVSAVEIEVGDTSASVYGYAKLDATYDRGDIKPTSSGLGNSIGFANLAVGDEATSSGHAAMHAWQSRLGVRTSTPTGQSDLITVIEGDFYGDGGGGFRLRHAYGSWNGITAGQLWTNFGSFVGDIPTLDFTGQIGRAGVNRQAQLRYSAGDFHVALEAPNGAVSGASYLGEGSERQNSLPDLTLRYESGMGNINYAAGALLRQVAFDDGERDDAATGWGLFVGGNVEVAQSTTLRALVAGGDGIGGYLNNSPAPAAYRDGDQLESLSAWGGTVGISQQVGPGSVNLAYSYASADWDDAETAGADVAAQDKARQLIHLNYLWSPAQRISYGVELAHVERKTVAGDSGDAWRLQGSVTYNF